MVSVATLSQALPINPVEVTDTAIAVLVAEGVRAVAEHTAAHWPHGESDAAYASPLGAANASELLIGMTHDMRSPLSSILVLVERLRSGQSGPVTPLQERQLGLVYSAAFGLAAVANDVLELSQGSTRLVGLEPIPFSIHESFRAVRALVQPIAEEKGLTLRCSAPSDDRRLGHPAAIQRVLLNLATNALKFTNSGTVDITASYRGDSDVVFEISDSGMGVPAAVRERFRNGSFDSGSETSGVGLGLGLCAQLVRRMQGTLHCVERTPCGSAVSFAVMLPRA